MNPQIYQDLHKLEKGPLLEKLMELSRVNFATAETFPESLFEETERILDATDPEISFWCRRVHYPLCRLRYSLKPQLIEGENRVDFCLQKLALLGQNLDIFLLGLLAQSREPRVLPPLLEFLEKCRDPFKVSLLVKHLGSFSDERMFDALFPFVNNSDARVVANCLEGLSATGSVKGIPVFFQALLHSHERVRTNALQAIKRFAPAQIRRALASFEKSSRPEIHEAVFEFVRSLGDRDYFPYIFYHLRDEPVRDRCMEFLSTHGDDHTLRCLEWYARENPRHMRFVEAVSQKIQSRLLVAKLTPLE